ncbi:MAG TPA: hypothetical protein VHT73_02570 [Thermodesulfobacteriota bacterium]|nr:hypothetical protein [Thermodesulfobacteriota bacterium]
MRNFIILTVCFLVVSLIFGVGKTMSAAEMGRTTTVQKQAGVQKEPQVKPDPMRSVCALMWNRYYQKENADIKVSTRGKYDEAVVFTCPDCSLEENFVNPFLNSEYQGKSGIARIKECGFKKAVFKGARGIQEIVRTVP